MMAVSLVKMATRPKGKGIIVKGNGRKTYMLEIGQNLNQAAIIKQQIVDNTVYEREEAIGITGFSLSTLIRAEKSGELRGRNIGRRRYYLGVDLLEWLQGDENGDGRTGREWKKR